MNSSTKLLREYIKEIVKETRDNPRRLRIFDFDDTLVKTDAKVHVRTSEGLAFDLTPGEFAVYDKRPGDVMDYTDFQKLINARAIGWTNQILRHVYDHHGPRGLVILSARSHAEPIHQYLEEAGYHGIEVVALDNADPAVKATWIDERIKRDKLEFVEFYDDSHKNIAAIRDLRVHHPETTIVARHIFHRRINSLLS